MRHPHFGSFDLLCEAAVPQVSHITAVEGGHSVGRRPADHKRLVLSPRHLGDLVHTVGHPHLTDPYSVLQFETCVVSGTKGKQILRCCEYFEVYILP